MRRCHQAVAREEGAVERPLKRVPEAVMSSEHRVIFTPSGLEGRVESETTVLDADRVLEDVNPLGEIIQIEM